MTHDDAWAIVVGILSRRAGIEQTSITASTRVRLDLGLDGDDAVEAILEIGREGGTDLSSFKAGDYFSSEPSILSIFKRRADMPALTVGQLAAAVQTGDMSNLAGLRRA